MLCAMSTQSPIPAAGPQVLWTKFHVPEADPDTAIPRRTLLADMADAADRQLILVRAPAGYGKTTFLAQWLSKTHLSERTAWVSLDARDNSSRMFWTYVLAALERIDPDRISRIRLLMESSPEPGGPDTLIPLINAVGTADAPFLLALDDFHHIRDPGILDGMNFLIDHPLPMLRIAIASRISPGLGLSRLRASGRLKEVTESMLVFDREETRDFSGRFGSPPLAGTALDTMVRKTEGWAAALKLAMISLSEHRITGLDHVAGNAGFIGEYLLEEVWQTLPRDYRTAMARISILNRFNRELVDALSPETGDTLGFLSDRRLFLIPLDEIGHWYRFHHLFQEFLVRQLEKSGPPGPFHRQAAAWFEARGYFEEAFDHALAAKDLESAARILAAHTPELYGEGGDDTLVPYLRRLPLTTVQANPVLAGYYYAVEVYKGHFDKLDEMAGLIRQQEETVHKAVLSAAHTALDAYFDFFVNADMRAAIRKSDLALERLPESHGAMRRMLEFLLSLCHRFLGQVTPARNLARSQSNDNLFMSGLYIMHRTSLELELGNLKTAGELVRTEIGRIEAAFGDVIPTAYGFLFIFMGTVLKEENRMAEADRYFAKGTALIRKNRFLELIIISLGEFAMFLCEAGRFDEAHDAIDQAISLSDQSPWIRDMMTGHKQQIWLCEGKTELVTDWALTYDLSPEAVGVFYRTLEYLTLARYWIAVKNRDKALAILDPMIPEDEAVRRNGRLIIVYLLKAKALFQSGDGETAGLFFSKAVEIGRSQGYIRCFLSELPGMEPLAETALKAGRLPGDLARALEQALQPSTDAVRQVAIHDIAEDFNVREIEILELFRQGRSNKEAARELALSVNTIRWYASRIFAKLCVKRRGQAVSRAAELGLI